MNSFGLTLSDELDMQDLDLESKSRVKTFNYFDYPTSKIKQKPFASFEYSLDDSMNIVMDEGPTRDNKYDEIIQRQQKLIDLLKDENGRLKMRMKELEDAETSHHQSVNLHQQILPVCYLLNIEYNNQFLYGEIYQAIESIMAQLVSSQNRVRQLQKRLKDSGMQRVNSTTYIEKPYNKDNRNKRGAVQYRQKDEVNYIEKLEKEVSDLRQQCNKLRSSAQSTPLFIPSIKQKRVQVVIEKIVEKIVERVVEKEIQKPVYIQKIVERPKIIEKIIEKPVYFEKKIKEEVPVYIEKIIEKPTPIYIDRQIQIQRILYVNDSSGKQSQSKHTQTQR